MTPSKPKDPFAKPMAEVNEDEDFAGLDNLDSFDGGHTLQPDQEPTSVVSLDGVDPPDAHEPNEQLQADIARAKEVGVSVASSTIEPLPENPRAVIDFAAGDREPIPVSKSVFVIGRGKEWADVVLSGEKVSRQHAAIIFASGEFFIEDLNSTNGTQIAGKKVKRVRLEAGVPVTIGGHTFSLRWEY